MRSRKAEMEKPLEPMGRGAERLARGEPLGAIMRDHHRAQVALGVIPPDVQQLIAEIENADGSAKVIGAGSRSGGAGMALALGNREEIQKIATERGMPTSDVWRGPAEILESPKMRPGE